MALDADLHRRCRSGWREGLRRLRRAARRRAAAVGDAPPDRSAQVRREGAPRALPGRRRVRRASRSTSAPPTRPPGSPAGCWPSRVGEDALVRFYRRGRRTPDFDDEFRRAFGLSEAGASRGVAHATCGQAWRVTASARPVAAVVTSWAAVGFVLLAAGGWCRGTRCPGGPVDAGAGRRRVHRGRGGARRGLLPLGPGVGPRAPWSCPLARGLLARVHGRRRARWSRGLPGRWWLGRAGGGGLRADRPGWRPCRSRPPPVSCGSTPG